jgi:transcriptional regulator GlxA family with amidase domain/YHS domain-containing protein
MRRRDFLQKSAAFGAVSSISLLTENLSFSADETKSSKGVTSTSAPGNNAIPVAFVISQGAVVIDFCGPWEVFQDANVPGRKGPAFDLYTVAESLQPVRASAGIRILPDYTFENAPSPKIIVIPAQRGQSEAMLNWIRNASRKADLTMSVCIGANVLAATGLLGGRPATTHHNSYGLFAARNPDIHVQRGVRFVDDGNVASAGGLSSGIDLALHVIERYFGREAATQTAYYMEYMGEGWKNPDANRMYKEIPVSSREHPRCAVCSMDVDPGSAPKVVLKGKEYYFCSQEHKAEFEKNPAAFAGDSL